jgi:hypothetical protein
MAPQFRIELLQARHRMRQHLQVDAGLVHLAQSQFAEIVEPLHRRRRRDQVETAGVRFTSGS